MASRWSYIIPGVWSSKHCLSVRTLLLQCLQASPPKRLTKHLWSFSCQKHDHTHSEMTQEFSMEFFFAARNDGTNYDWSFSSSLSARNGIVIESCHSLFRFNATKHSVVCQVSSSDHSSLYYTTKELSYEQLFLQQPPMTSDNNSNKNEKRKVEITSNGHRLLYSRAAHDVTCKKIRQTLTPTQQLQLHWRQ